MCAHETKRKILTASLLLLTRGAVETTTESTAGGRAGLTLGGTVDLDLATLEVLLVQGLDGAGGGLIISEGDEAEAAGATYDKEKGRKKKRVSI